MPTTVDAVAFPGSARAPRSSTKLTRRSTANTKSSS